MSLSSNQAETAAITVLTPGLEAEGFQVFAWPSSTMLPPFMRSYRPDAIAVRGDQKVAIEIKSGRDHDRPRLEWLRKLFLDHPDWELRIIYAPQSAAETRPTPSSRESIVSAAGKLLPIFDEQGAVAGLLTAWSVLEAAARLALPDYLGGPQTPAELLQILGTEGYLTPTEIDELRRVAGLRNQAAHGVLDVAPARSEIQLLVESIAKVLEPAQSE